jgi:retinol dehydrogenase-12
MSAKKIAVVTGASSGIGLETARGLAREGLQVVLAVRDLAKGEAARAEIAGSVPGAVLHVLRLDLASQASIRGFARELEDRFPQLDVLVNNAALVPATRVLTEDGFETQFGVNHLGPFLLTMLLLPRLRASKAGRVVVVSSSAHKGAKLDFDDLQAERGYSQIRAYGQSKLMNILFVRALAKRLEGTGVMVNAVHPGVVSTGLARDFPAAFRWMAKLFFTSPAKGARTSIWLATSPEVAGVSGGYFAKQKQEEPDAAAKDEAAAEQLWEVSERLCGLAAA